MADLKPLVVDDDSEGAQPVTMVTAPSTVVISDTPTGESTSEDVDVKQTAGNKADEPGKSDSDIKVPVDNNVWSHYSSVC